jgi:hypothetical protein
MSNKNEFKGYWIICTQSYKYDGQEIPKGRMYYHNSTRSILSNRWRKATEKEVLEKKYGKNGFYNIQTINNY